MSVLDPFREEVASAIMTPCLVARDRTGRSLFISDYPRRLPQHEATHIDTALRRLGWQVDRGDDNLAHLDWTPARYAGYFDALPHAGLPAPREDTFLLWGVAGALLRHDTPAYMQDIVVLRQALLLVTPARYASFTPCCPCLSPCTATKHPAIRSRQTPDRSKPAVNLPTTHHLTAHYPRKEAPMLITYHGHAEFLIETANGYRILTDPYDAKPATPCAASPPMPSP